jgi:hypothetical protein
MGICRRHDGNAALGHGHNTMVRDVLVIDLGGKLLVYLVVLEGVGQA